MHLLDADGGVTARASSATQPDALHFSVPVFAAVYALLFLAVTLFWPSAAAPTAGLEGAVVVAAALLGGCLGALASRGGFNEALRLGVGSAVVAALCVAVARFSFRDIDFDLLSAPFWPAVAAAVSVPFARSATREPVRLSLDPVAAVTILGILLSGALCDYPWWWQRSISFLGYGVRLHRWVFDATVLACAALLLARSGEVSRNLYALEPLGLTDSRRRRATVGVYRVAAVSLLLVIAFPYGNGRDSLWSWVHNIGAWIAFGVLALAVAAAPVLTPFLRSDLRRESLATFAVVAGLFALYWPGRYLSLALFEVMSLILILLWLARWTRALAALATQSRTPSGRRVRDQHPA